MEWVWPSIVVVVALIVIISRKKKKKYYDHTYIAELDGKKSSNNDIDDVDVDID